MAVIGLLTDSVKMPNLALMKLAAYHSLRNIRIMFIT